MTGGQAKERADCFAHRKDGCSVLNKTICRERECSFYKTAEQFQKEREYYAKKLFAAGMEGSG